MTPAQKRWLAELRRVGFIEAGGWNRGQRNRPLHALVQKGLAEFDCGPRDSFLRVQGFLAPADFVGPFMPARAETLRAVVNFFNA